MNSFTSFTYLGVIFTSNLSWNLHINKVRTKSRKILGLIYQNFDHHQSFRTILRLFSILVLPHLTYCSSVRAPSSSLLVILTLNFWKKFQHFTLKLYTHQCTSDYAPFLTTLQLPTLSNRSPHAKRHLLYKIINNRIYYHPDLFKSAPNSHMSTHYYHSSNITIPSSSTLTTQLLCFC